MLKILFINLLLPVTLISTPVIASSGIFVATDNNPIKVEEQIILEEPERFAKEKIDKNLSKLKEKLEEDIKNSWEKLFSWFKDSVASESAEEPASVDSVIPPLVSKPSEPPKSPDVVTDLEASDTVVDASTIDTTDDSVSKNTDPDKFINVDDSPIADSGDTIPPNPPVIDTKKTISSDPAETESKEVASVDKTDKPEEVPTPPKISESPSSSTGSSSSDTNSSKSSSASNKINTMSSEALKNKLNALIKLKTSMLNTEIKDKTQISNAKNAWDIIQNKINSINDVKQLQTILNAITGQKTT